MRTLIVAGLVLLVGTVAYGQDIPSEIAFTVELGGNNHVADWENAGSIVTTAFTPGQAADAQVFDEQVMGTSVITWDVVVTSQGFDSANGIYFQGAANIAFNVELQKEDGSAVTGNRFLSTMNDGDGDGWRRTIQGVTDPYEKAAFCVGWDVDMDYNGVFDGVFGGVAGNPGRLFDAPTAAGPGMDRAQFPSNTYHGGGRLKGTDTNYWRDCNGNNPSLGATLTDWNGDGRKDDLDEIGLGLAADADGDGIIDACEAGTVSLAGTAGERLVENKLSGMGVGYSEFTVGSNNLGVGLALGSTPVMMWGTGSNVMGLNATPAIPAAEGQIDMAGLPAGNYKLVITVPANANNVIAADYIPDNGGGFAVKAANVVTDTITFQWNPQVDPVIPVTPQSWKSVRNHTNVGPLGITLSPTDGQATVEPRIGSGGQLQRIEVTMSGDITKAAYVPNAVTYTGPAGMTVTTSVEGANNEILVLTIAGAADKSCYTYNISGCCALTAGADPTCAVVVLGGDVTSSATAATKTVSNGDVTLTKQNVGKPVDATTCKFDVNCGGTIVNGDMSQVKTKVGNTAAACQ